MIAVLGVLMLPAVATIIPLFIFLNQFQIEFGDWPSTCAASLLGVTLAVISAQLPFAIWNLKGYLDTIPKDLEEAAAVDGATQNQIFRKVVLPLAIPAIAVTGFLGFLGGWTEYLTASCSSASRARLDAVARAQQHGRPVRAETPWSEFARSRSCSPCRSRSCSSSSSATWSAASPSAASRAESAVCPTAAGGRWPRSGASASTRTVRSLSLEACRDRARSPMPRITTRRLASSSTPLPEAAAGRGSRGPRRS